MNASRFMCCARLSTLSIQFLFYRFSRSLVDVQNQKFHHTDKNVDEINIKNNQICLQQSTSKAGIQVNYERRQVKQVCDSEKQRETIAAGKLC